MPIPPKTAEQTKAILMQFPVSSGQHHRLNESEWVPVEPSKPTTKNKATEEQSTSEAPTASKSATKTQAKVKDDEMPQPTAGT